MAEEFEKINLEESKMEARFTRSDYAQVLFHNTAESYAVDKDIEFRYTINSLLEKNDKDWIGLYKVGWSSATRDYVIYDYVSIEQNAKDGEDKNGIVHFTASKLPKDDGEFYQVCYVTSSGHVRGASTPFQFRDRLEEFIEIEDEDNDIMVIKSRTAVLEDDLNKAKQDEYNLKRTLDLLKHERDSLLNKMIDLEKACQSEKEEKEATQTELKKLQEKIEALSHEAADMVIVQDSLRDQINILKQEKESIEARMNDNDQYVVSLRDKIKSLVNEKDMLSGKNKSLEEEKDMYKENFSSTETTISGYKLEIDNLKKQLHAVESNFTKTKTEVEACNKAIIEERKKMERQLSVAQTDKNHIQDLMEKLRNCEDKLMAAEQCKQMLNKELDTVQQAYSKMSDDMERSKSEAYSLKSKISKLEEHSSTQQQSWKDELKFMQGQMDQKSQECERLQQDVEKWRQKFEEMEVAKKSQDEGPLFALQMAQATLKERLARKQAENDEYKKQVDDLMARKRKWDQKEMELKKEVIDLKEHLLMGQDAFRDKYIECQKLRADLKKALKTQKGRTPSECLELSRSSSVDSKVSKDDIEVQIPKIEDRIVRNDCEAQTTESLRTGDLADLTNCEIQSQLDDLGKELEKRKLQKNKYKALLSEEKEKNSLLQKHYFEQLKEKDEEIQHIKQANDEKMQILLQKNRILANALEKEQAERRRRTVAQSGGQEAAAHAQAAVYPPDEEAIGGHSQPLPLRFGSPYQPMFPQGAAASDYEVIQPTLNTGGSPHLVEHYDLALVRQEYDPLVTPPAPRVDAALPLPLPLPLEPQRTTEAKKAAVMAAMNDEARHSASPPVPADVGVALQPSAPARSTSQDALEAGATEADEDRFQDAQGDPQRICPICSQVFPPDSAHTTFLDHVDAHYGPVCPVCAKQFEDGFSPSKFQEHVEEHFQD